MIWTIDEVISALAVEFETPRDTRSISMPIYDSVTGIGIGIDGQGLVCLVLPGSENQVAFETKALKFDPWCDTTWLEKNKELPKCSVLRCRLDRSDTQLSRLVLGILLSLVDLQVRFKDAGHAILTLKELFGDGFKVTTPLSVVRGLIGELLIIEAAPDTKAAILAWHVDADDRYDFSINNTRVEVKTTVSSVRQHQFTSRQLPPLHGINVWIASVQLAEVSVGETLSGLFNRIVLRIDTKTARKLLDVVIETMGLPPGAVLEPQFDLLASIESISLYKASQIPTPVFTAGTSDIRWVAYLNQDSDFGIQNLNQILDIGG